MPSTPDVPTMVLTAWSTSNQVTVYLVDHLPQRLWAATVPGVPQRTIRQIAAHLHNSRCSWIRTLGREHGLTVPVRVDHRKATRRQVAAALKRSGKGIEALLRLGLARGGVVPPSRGYVWRNLPLDVGHVLTYFVAHDSRHHGQIVLVARQLNQRLPGTVTGGLWQWTTFRRAARMAATDAYPALAADEAPTGSAAAGYLPLSGRRRPHQGLAAEAQIVRWHPTPPVVNR